MTELTCLYYYISILRGLETWILLQSQLAYLFRTQFTIFNIMNLFLRFESVSQIPFIKCVNILVSVWYSNFNDLYTIMLVGFSRQQIFISRAFLSQIIQVFCDKSCRLVKNHSKNSLFPKRISTILAPHNSPIDVSELLETSQPLDCKALKYWNIRSGCK